jgi:SAM-dependent methyltransferase
MATQAPPIDHDKLMELLHRAVGDLGGVVGAAMVVIGDRLGLYRALAEGGPATAAELAERTDTAERYVREWLAANAAGGYVEYDAGTGRYHMTPEQTAAFAAEDSPAFLPGAFQIMSGAARDEPAITEAFRTGAGVGWHEHNDDVYHGCERFFRPGYNANLLSGWIPALEGVDAKLRAGGRVADVGCGHGASSLLIAEAYPATAVTGFDYHPGSIATARERARGAGLDARVGFEVASAKEFSGTGYDLVACFDCLHDMGDPVGAARHVREAIAPDGTWMIVEPFAGDRVEDNLNPIGRVYYGASTLLCTPSSLAQEVGLALGAQAGEAQIRDVVTAGGFTRFRRVAETPFNIVFEARP